MRLKGEKVRKEKLYAVGYSAELEMYVMEYAVTWIAWYNRYFAITEEEYRLFDSASERLDALTERFGREGVSSERFICSEKPNENSTEEQRAALTKIRQKS